jgi:hypothetical protein
MDAKLSLALKRFQAQLGNEAENDRKTEDQEAMRG